MKVQRKKLLFLQSAHLFDRTGTAVLYRRLMPLLPEGWAVDHVYCSWIGSLPPSQVAQRYADALPAVRPIALPLGRAIRLYTSLLRRLGREIRQDLIAGLSRPFVRKLLKSNPPDLVWLSSDHLPFSHRLFAGLLGSVRRHRVHVSIYDPLEIWPDYDAARKCYERVIARADSLDVIGENLQERLQREAPGKPVDLLNDYVGGAARPERRGELGRRGRKGVIAGRIYEADGLRQLADAFSASDQCVEIEWFGTRWDFAPAAEVEVREGVTWRHAGLLDRAALADRVESADFGYLSMPNGNLTFGRYSLPTKLVTYIDAGLPVLFHASEESEINRLNRRYGFGENLSLASNPAAKVAEFLAAPERYRAGIGRLAQERFSRARVAETLAGILNG